MSRYKSRQVKENGEVNVSRLNVILRNITKKKDRERLRNTTPSLISSNCNGAFILHDLGLQFRSPFVNLWMKPHDYIKLLRDLEYYLSCELVFTTENNISYPIGCLDDVKIYFEHYKSEVEAKEKWDERKQRIDLENLFILFSDRDGCTYEDLKEFDSLPYKNKIVFTNKPYSDIVSSFYIKGFENEPCVGACYDWVNGFSGKKIYDQFDYVAWFNGEKI